MMNSIARSTWGRRPLAALLLGLLALTALLSASPATASSVAQQSPPGRVDSITVTRADGTLTASWNAPAGATKYHITYSSDYGASWSLGAFGHTSTSLTIAVDNPKTYIVGVRAGNDAGWGAWRNSSTVGPFVPTKPPPPPAPGTTSSVSTVRADGALTASWPAVAHAETYHITYSSDAKHSWSLAAFDHATTNITINVDNDKTYVVGVRAKNMSGAGGWRNSPSAAPFVSPPAAPTGLSVTPGNGDYAVAWSAVSTATGYDVRAKTSGASNWHDVASNVTGTSYTYTTSSTLDHIGVRARNDGGASAWTEISRSPSNEWLTTVQQFGGASLQMAQSQAQAQSQTKLTAPTLGTITRDHGARGSRSSQSITINWNAITGATGYNVVCSATDGWTWWQCGAITSGSTTTLTVDRGPNGYQLGKYRSYKLAVRAVNSNPSDASDWTNSANIRPVNPQLSNFTSTRTDGQLTLSWTPTPWTTGYLVDCAVADMTPPYSPSVYTRCATLSNQDDTATQHSVTITKSGGTHNWSSLDNTSTLDIKITSTNQWGQAEWLAPLIAPPPTLTASDVTKTTATLTIGRHSGQWWYKANASPDNTCKGPIASGTASKDLTGLTSYTSYTYKAYDATGCATADEIAAVTFTTGVSVSNLSETEASASLNLGSDWGQEFTTGSAANGYKLQSVTLDFAIVNPSGNITVSLREQQSNNHPATTALATLTGTPAQGQVTFTCSGAGCNLNASTTYFVFVDGNEVVSNLRSTASDNETPQPSGNGWSIENAVRYQAGSWALHPQGVSMKVKIEALSHPSLTGASTSSTGATLAISQHTGTWHYKANTGPHTTCQGPVSTSSVTLTGLTAGTSYTYTAYSDSGCATPLASATFATPPGNPQSVSVGSDNFDGNIRRYPVSWNKPANTQATDSFGYQVECTSVNDRNTTNWTACGTHNVASTSNASLSRQVQHGWSDATFKYVRVRTEKNGLYSAWVIAKTTFGS